METTTTPPGIVEAQNLDDFPPDEPFDLDAHFGKSFRWKGHPREPVLKMHLIGFGDAKTVALESDAAEIHRKVSPEQFRQEIERGLLVPYDAADAEFDRVTSIPGARDGAGEQERPGALVEVTDPAELAHIEAEGAKRFEEHHPGLDARLADDDERGGLEERALARITPEACNVEPETKKRARKVKAEQEPKAEKAPPSDEWYLPPQYAASVRKVLGAIDLDPASCELANKTIQAAKIYTIETDGFDKPWTGRVYLNPPYNDGGSARWSARLIEQYEAGVTTEAILLVNASTERSWFQPLWQFPICFTDHRIAFYEPNGERSQPRYGNAFVYLGSDLESFRAEFRQYGAVVVPMTAQAKATEPIAKEDVLRALAAADEAEISIAGVLKDGKWSTRLVYPADAESIASILHFTDCLKQELGAKWTEILQDRRREEEALAAKLGLTS